MAKLASPGLERPVEAVPHCSNSSTKNSLPGVTARAGDGRSTGPSWRGLKASYWCAHDLRTWRGPLSVFFTHHGSVALCRGQASGRLAAAAHGRTTLNASPVVLASLSGERYQYWAANPSCCCDGDGELAQTILTTLCGGSLGSCVDEERSQLRELM